MPIPRPSTTVLTRIAIGLALALAAWTAWGVLSGFLERGGGDDSGAIARVEDSRRAIETLEQQSLIRATTARRWRELFDEYWERDAVLGEVSNASNSGILRRARSRVREAEQMRDGLLLSELDEEQRRSRETDFRTTLGLASEDLKGVARSLRSQLPAEGSASAAGLAFRVGACLLALLIATLLITEEIAVVRFRPGPHLRVEPAAAPGLAEAPVPENLQTAERLAARIALRFNQLLTPINGYCELLLDSLAPSDPARGDIEEIRKAGRKAAILSRQLQAFGRQEDYEPSQLDLNDWIGQQQDRLRSLVGEATTIVLELESPAGVVRADPRQLRRILDALSLNSADAMPEGGTLRIRTAPTHREGAGALALLEISDSGTGMDAETRSRLFEPLFSTKTPGRGAGLSLATVKGTVERLGGSIEVASEPGRGATFRIYLPRLVEVPADSIPPRTRAAHA